MVENPVVGGTKVGVGQVLIFFAEVAHLVEHDLAKVGVAGSSPVFRSEYLKQIIISAFFFKKSVTRVVELVDTQDLKSCLQQWRCGFNSHPGYW